MKCIKLSLIILSLIAFVLGFIFPELYLWICGIPGLVFVFGLIHELSHALACKIMKTKINAIEIFGFVLYDHFEIKPNLSIFGKVNFDKTSNDKFIFGFGIIISVLLTAVSVLLYVFNLINILYLIVVCVCMVALLIPVRNSDIRKIFERR